MSKEDLLTVDRLVRVKGVGNHTSQVLLVVPRDGVALDCKPTQKRLVISGEASKANKLSCTARAILIGIWGERQKNWML